MERVLITGSSGYFGGKLTSFLQAKPEIKKIVGLDIHPPSRAADKLIFHAHDVRQPCDAILREHDIDTVIHAAWILPPTHDKDEMEDINLNGTRQVFNAAARCGVSKLLFTSSTTAYGFHPDNEKPLTEDSPLRGNEDFTYAKCKRIVDQEVCCLAQEHPQMAVTIVRPCFVVGPGFNNPMARHLRKKVVMVPKSREALQYVHEDDLVEAMYQLLDQGKAGVFNVAGQGVISFDEMVEMLGGILLPIPFKVLWALNALAWKLRLGFLTEFPSPTLNIFRYPWVASSAKLEKELGFTFRFDTKGAFEDFARHVSA